MLIRAIMSAVALLALVGCSSAVSNGMARQEWTVLGPASTREDAERFLGKPVFFESFVHPKTIDEVAAELAPRLDVPNVPLFTPRYIVDAGTGKFEAVALPVSIVSHAKYRIVGSFLPRGAPGGPEEAVKCAIGISDVSAIPISVSYAPSTTSKPVIVGNGGAGGLSGVKAYELSADARTNVFDVWYGEDGRPWAFQWRQTDPNDMGLGI